jgi:GT2 family glycosyltransferase
MKETQMEASTRPRVYTIILNWNNYEDTKKCLQSLRGATYPNLITIVVDNGSSDGSGKRLRPDFPELQFIFNDKNLGFSKGCNVGIRAAMEDPDCAYVLLLNNDSEVAPGFLEKAVETAEADGRIGLVGGKILHSPESKIIAYAGGEITRLRGQVTIRGFSEIDHGQYDKPDSIGFVTGALMLIKREVIEKIGPLPEEYFFGIEELDYSFHVRIAGYKLYYVPEFVAYHVGDGSHWNWDPKFVYNGYRSRLIFQEKYLPRGLFPVWKLVFTLYAKYRAKRFWRKLAEKHSYDKGKVVPYEDMEYALLKALEDHGKNDLCEETLARFEQSLKQRKVVSAKGQ